MIFEHRGQGLSLDQCDLLALQVNAEHRQSAIELAAMQTRWWDYCLLHPTQATYLLAEHYRRAVVEWHRRWVDVDTAEQASAFAPDDVFKSRELTSFWLARQFYDQLGVPYEFGVSFCMDRAFARGFRAMLRPNQLYGEELEVDLGAAWREEGARSLRTAALPFLRASNFASKPQQRRYREWLIERVKARSGPQHRLVARLLNEDALSDAAAEAAFGPEVITAARRYQQLLAA